jgi:hypothetical protein
LPFKAYNFRNKSEKNIFTLLFARTGPYLISTGKVLPYIAKIGQLLKNYENWSVLNVAEVIMTLRLPLRLETAFFIRANSTSVYKLLS